MTAAGRRAGRDAPDVSLSEVTAQVIRINSPIYATTVQPGVEATAEGALVAAEQLRALTLAPLPDRGALPPTSRISALPNPTFVNRAAELEAVGEFLTRGSARTLSVCGLAGSGKSSLAAEAAYRFGRWFPAGVFWLNLGDPLSAESEVAACGEYGHLDLVASVKPSLAALAAAVLQAWSGPVPVLLVFDNCEDEPTLERWLPRFGASKVLVTSRRTTWTRALGMEPLVVGPLDEPAGAALLGAYRPDLAQDPSLPGIVDRVGSMPFALDLVGRFLEGLEGTMAHGAPQLEGYLDEALDRAAASAPEAGDHLSAMWGLVRSSLTTMDAEDTSGSLSRLLTAVAQFAPAVPVPLGLIATVARSLGVEAADDEVGFAKLIARVGDSGLLVRLDVSSVRLHPLVHEYLNATGTDMDAVGAAGATCAELFAQINVIGDSRTGDNLLPHIRHVAGRMRGDGELDGEPVFSALAIYLAHRGLTDESKLWAAAALEAAEAHWGPGRPETALAQNLVGYSLLHANEPEPAIEQFLVALPMFRELGDRVNEAAVIDNLGQATSALGRLPEAIQHHEEALAIRLAHLGEHSDRTAVTLTQLAIVSMAMGDYVAGRSYAQRAATARREAFEDEPTRGLVISDYWVGLLSGFLCDWPAAQDALASVLNMDEELNAEPSDPALDAMLILAIVGDVLDGGDSRWRDQLAAHPGLQQVRASNAAFLAFRAGRPDLGAALLDASGIDLAAGSTIVPLLITRMRCALAGEDLPAAHRLEPLLVARSAGANGVEQARLSGLRGDLALADHRFEEACGLHRLAVEAASGSLGDESVESQRWRTRLAASLAAAGQRDEAGTLLTHVVEVAAGKAWLRELADAHYGLARLHAGSAAGLDAARTALDLRERCLGAGHPDTARAAHLVEELGGIVGSA